MTVIYNSFGIDGKGTGKLDRLRSNLNEKYYQSNSSAAKNPDFIKNTEDVDNLPQTMRSHNSAANPQPQESANPDFVGREDATADSTSEDDLNELVKRVRSQFRDKIQDQCGSIRMLDVDGQVGVDNIYIPLNVLEKLSNNQHLEVSDFQRLNPANDNFDRFGRGEISKAQVPALEVVARKRKLMVLGKPGSGKTTFLKFLAIQCTQGDFQPELVPIFIELKAFARYAKRKGEFSLLKYITHELAICQVSEQQIETLLYQGRFLILLDGLDEVPVDTSEEALTEFEFFKKKYFRNRFVITCRIADKLANKRYCFNFTDVEVADFNSQQIETFAQKWFVAFESNSRDKGLIKANQFIEKLYLQENMQIRELAVTPILLNLICLVFQKQTAFTSKRSRLYEQGIDILLERWDESRNIQRDNTYRNLSLEDKKDLLSQIAAIAFERGDYFFEQEKILRDIADYLRTLAETEPKSLARDSKAVLKSIEVQGLLVERARGIYSFSHLTFQEYFTARKIVSSCKPDVLNYQALQNLARYITETRWREVFLLAVEILPFPSTDRLLLLMKQQVDFLVATDERLQQFLSWVNQKSCLDKVSLAAVRAFYFEIALSLNRIINNLNPNPVVPFFEDDLKLELAFALGLNLKEEYYSNNDIYLDRELAYAFGDAPTYADTKHFDIATELKHLLQQLEIKMLDDYHSQLFLHHYGEYEDSWQSEWIKEVKNLAEQLRVMLIKYRNIGHDWKFSEQQEKLLDQYYYANKLLVECLNSGCNVDTTVRSDIEDTLLLPIDDIEKLRIT